MTPLSRLRTQMEDRRGRGRGLLLRPGAADGESLSLPGSPGYPQARAREPSRLVL